MRRSTCHVLVLLALLAAACSPTDDGPADGTRDGGETVYDVTFGQATRCRMDRASS